MSNNTYAPASRVSAYTQRELLAALANWHHDGFRVLVMTETMPDRALKAACRDLFGKKNGEAIMDILYCNYHLGWVDQELYEQALGGFEGR